MDRVKFRYLFRAFVIFLITCVLIACQSAPAADGDQPDTRAKSTAPTSFEPTATPAPPTATPSPEPTTIPTEIPTEETEHETIATVTGARLFEIAQDQSEARFRVEEVLLGADKTVIGVTSQITGSITVDPDNPSAASISAITIDARDFSTDSSRRNRSIQRRILGSASDEFRYITFVPTAIEGLPASVAIGETFTFSVTGDLTVRGVTQPETFALSVTPRSTTELTGLGSATVLYEDYELAIPEVPAVAGVDDEVRLEIDFVATAIE